MLTNSIPSSLYSCDQVRQIDKLAIESGIAGIQLMKRAGRALFNAGRELWPEVSQFLVFCGAGNNGGDGYIFAALAAQKCLKVKVIALSDPDKLIGDAQLARQFAQQEQVDIVYRKGQGYDDLAFDSQTLILDALLGTGSQGEPRDDYKKAIEWINGSGCPVLSADLPSGLNADTGAATTAIKAHATVTFVGCKRGLFTGRGPSCVGELWFDDLEIPANIRASLPPSAKKIHTGTEINLLENRVLGAHKGLYGHVLIVGGGPGCGGAASMAAEAALYSGAGLVSVATLPEHVPGILARVPEVMVTGVTSGQALKPLLSRPSVIVIGPGLGRTPWSEQMLQQVLSTDIPLVVDADGLNILAEGRMATGKHRQNWVLTPHPGEAARLLGITTAEVQSDRFHAVTQMQKQFGGVCVLKGLGSLVASDHGPSLAKVGNPGMATGGMGDVLCGIVGALLAQGLTLQQAAELAVCVHGDAGDLAALEYGQRGLRATELIPYVRELLNPVR